MNPPVPPTGESEPIAEARALLARVVAASDSLDLLSVGHLQLAAGSLETLCAPIPPTLLPEQTPSTDIVEDLRRAVRLLINASADAATTRAAFCLTLITRQLNDIITDLTRSPT